jgi:hypothetical protein
LQEASLRRLASRLEESDVLWQSELLQVLQSSSATLPKVVSQVKQQVAQHV